MAKRKQARTYRMTLGDFYRYLDAKEGDLTRCHQEITEVRDTFRDILTREMVGWQETFGVCYPEVLSKRREMPPAFAELIDRTEREEHARIEREIAELAHDAEQGHLRMDELTAQAQAATTELRTSNPQLDAREEHHKARLVKLQDEYADAYDAIEELESSTMGWLTNAFKIRRYKKIQRKAKKQQVKTLGLLRRVRREWLDSVEKTGDVQAELRGTWQETSVEVSQAQSRHDHLSANIETLAEQSGVQRVIEELTAAPPVEGELGEALQDMVRRNEIRRAYEGGLGAAAQIMGLSAGVHKGMKKFKQSVHKVWQEQRRYNLKEVQVEIPHWAAAMNEMWKQFAERIRNEKRVGDRPNEFEELVEQQMLRHWTNENIQRLFETMGEALNRATTAWD